MFSSWADSSNTPRTMYDVRVSMCPEEYSHINESRSHAKWDGKYHVVFLPKGRKKTLYGKIRGFLGPVLRERVGQRGSTIVEGHMVPDHVHMLIRIPPKYAVAEVIGSIKGRSIY